MITYTERYDSLGKYWRIQEYKFTPRQSDLGGTPIFYTGQDCCDVERIHGGSSDRTMLEMSPDIDRKMFTLRGLRKGSY
jgi:hypothetical protein